MAPSYRDPLQPCTLPPPNPYMEPHCTAPPPYWGPVHSPTPHPTLPGHVQTYSTWTSLYRDLSPSPRDMLKRVHYEPRPVGKRAAIISLECLLVFCSTHSSLVYRVNEIRGRQDILLATKLGA